MEESYWARTGLGVNALPRAMLGQMHPSRRRTSEKGTWEAPPWMAQAAGSPAFFPVEER